MTPNIEISTVVGCRMGCSYCPQKIHVKNYMQHSKRMTMQMDDYLAMLYKIPLNVEIMFAGMAEPWINPSATAMISHANTAGFRIGVYTTCYGMKEEDITPLSQINFIHFCLHLPDDAGVMNLDVTEEYINVVKRCFNEIPGATAMCIGNLHPRLKEAIGSVEDGSRSLISRAGNLPYMAIKKKSGPLYCSACTKGVIDHNVILPNGDVLLCCMDYAQKHVIGNLLHQSYESLFKSDEYIKVMDGLNDDTSDIICRTCEIAEPTN